MVDGDLKYQVPARLGEADDRACSSRLEHLAHRKRIRRKDCGSDDRSEPGSFEFIEMSTPP